jgi:hypothetical protein
LPLINSPLGTPSSTRVISAVDTLMIDFLRVWR